MERLTLNSHSIPLMIVLLNIKHYKYDYVVRY